MNLTLKEGYELPDDTHLTISGGEVQCRPSLCILLILISTLLKKAVQTLENRHKCQTQLLATSLAQLHFLKSRNVLHNFRSGVYNKTNKVVKRSKREILHLLLSFTTNHMKPFVSKLEIAKTMHSWSSMSLEE